jgi:hypothetical protein
LVSGCAFPLINKTTPAHICGHDPDSPSGFAAIHPD